METYMNIPDLAAYIKCSEQTVRRYVLNRTVPYHKIHTAVRFRLSEIEKWIDGGGMDGGLRRSREMIRRGICLPRPGCLAGMMKPGIRL